MIKIFYWITKLKQYNAVNFQAHTQVWRTTCFVCVCRKITKHVVFMSLHSRIEKTWLITRHMNGKYILEERQNGKVYISGQWIVDIRWIFESYSRAGGKYFWETFLVSAPNPDLILFFFLQYSKARVGQLDRKLFVP